MGKKIVVAIIMGVLFIFLQGSASAVPYDAIVSPFEIWPTGTLGWDHQPVTYDLNYSLGTGDIAGDAEWDAILNAFNTWEAVPTSFLDFEPSLDGPDIFIGGWDDPYGDFAANPTALAVTYQFSPWAPYLSYSEMWFNDNFTWRIGADYDVETVALHEIGHTFGLGHSDVPGSIMWAYYTGVQTTLGPDDIEGVTYLYPAPTPEPSTIVLLASGLLGIGVYGRTRFGRKKRN